jgi:two-component system, NarL family, nitrate/nitrite response regulator NarL
VVAAVKIILADKHVVFLDGLTAALSQVGFEIVATATTRHALLEHVRVFQPEICVTGNRFPDGIAIDAIGQISDVSPGTKVVMLTADDNSDTMRHALEAGTAGYVHKSRGVVLVADVLHRVRCGEIVVEGSFLRPQHTDANAPAQLRRLAAYLTHRELECLALLAEGLDTAAMARRLGVSRTTVRSHVQAVLTKLGVHSRLEAASLAIRFGLVGARPTIASTPAAGNWR